MLGCLNTEKDVHRTDRNIPLFEGEDIPHPDPDSPFAEVGTNVHLEQLKDMLLTYNEYNRDLGYVQGMSDLLAPIYAVMQDDAIAFWGFVGFMERMVVPTSPNLLLLVNNRFKERNFLRDQSGMRAQLLTLDHLVQLMDPALYLHLQSADSTNFFFFFRMLLVWYKREFEWADVLRLWESLWTDHLSSQFHLFIALAILEKHRNVIMEHLKHFDEVLKYGTYFFEPKRINAVAFTTHLSLDTRMLIFSIVNELSNTIDLPSTLFRAQALFRRFQRTVEAIDKKHNFPTPSIRQRKPADSTANDKSGKSPQTGATAVTGNSIGDAVAKGVGAEKEKVISPELRALLSREIIKLDKKQVEEHGGGVGARH